MEVKDYISIVLSHVKNKVYLASIEQELKDHIADRAGYYEEIGYDAEVSLQKAMERIGNPDEVGEQMNRLHTSKGTEIAVLIIKLVQVAAWAIFLFGADSIQFVPTSASYFSVKADMTIAFLFFIILICCCVEFRIASTSRNNKLMKSVAYAGVFMPFITFLNIPDSMKDISLDFSVFADMPFSEHLANITQQFMCLYIFFVLAILVLTGIVSYMLAAEFKAFEKGTAQMSVIYSAEKYKYFLYAMCVPFVVYVVLLVIG